MFHLFTKIDSISTSELEANSRNQFSYWMFGRRWNFVEAISKMPRMSLYPKSDLIHQRQKKHFMSFVILVCVVRWLLKS